MNKEELIKKLSKEFAVDATETSEYFYNVFETLAVAFSKNKNVNISEFGKFILKIKTGKNGERDKNIYYSTVKKFAEEANENFSELSIVKLRTLDEKSLKENIFYTKDIAFEFDEIEFIDVKNTSELELQKEEHEVIKQKEEQGGVALFELDILIPDDKYETEDIEVEPIPSEVESLPEKKDVRKEELKQETTTEKEERNLNKEKEKILGELRLLNIPEFPKEKIIISKEEKHIIIFEKPKTSIIETVPEPLTEEKVISPEKKIFPPEVKVIPLEEKDIPLEEKVIPPEEKTIYGVDEILPFQPEAYPPEKIDLKDIRENVIHPIDEIILPKDEEISVKDELIDKQKEEITDKFIEQPEEEKITDKIIEQPIKELITDESTDKQKEEINIEASGIKHEEQEKELKADSTEEEELLRMLEERKKILDEIKELENGKPEPPPKKQTVFFDEDIYNPDLESTGLKNSSIGILELFLKNNHINYDKTEETKEEFNITEEQNLLTSAGEPTHIDEKTDKEKEESVPDIESEIPEIQEPEKPNNFEPEITETDEIKKQNIFESDFKIEEIENDKKPEQPFEDSDKNFDALKALLGFTTPEIPKSPETPEFPESTIIPETPKTFESIESSETPIIPESKDRSENNIKEETKEFNDTKADLDNLEMQIFDKLLDEPQKMQDTEEEDFNLLALQKQIEGLSLNKEQTIYPEDKLEEVIKEKHDYEFLKERTKEENLENVIVPIEEITEPDIKTEHKPTAPPPKEKKKSITLLKISIMLIVFILFVIVTYLIYHKITTKQENPINTENIIQQSAEDSTKKSNAGNETDSLQKLSSTQSTDTTKKSETAEIFKNANTEDEKILIEKGDYILKQNAEGDYFIQIGVFDNPISAGLKTKEMKAKNYHPYMDRVEAEGKEFYRLKLGPYKTIEEAKTTFKKLE